MVIEKDNESHVRIVSGFEGSNILNVRKVSNNHLEVMIRPDEPSDYEYPDHQFYWFFLKLVGAKDQTVTIDIINCDWMPSHWNHYKPVCSYSFDNESSANHDWQKIAKTRRRGNIFSFTHTYEEDQAWIALRYPYTYSYHQNYMARIEKSPYVRREILLKTEEGRNLDVLTITDHDSPDKSKKGIWICAREHGVEQDGSWVCQGMINYLLTDSPEAAYLRKKAVFVLIPILSPDAAFHGRCVNPNTGYSLALDFCPARMKTRAANSILSRLHQWIASGCNLDICIGFHNPHGTEPNIWPVAYPNKNKKDCKSFIKTVFATCEDYTIKRLLYRTLAPNFAGRCAAEFGALGFTFEINHQARRRFLTLDDLRGIGVCFCKGIYQYLRSKERTKKTVNIISFLSSVKCT